MWDTKEEMDNEQLEILLCSANSYTDVGDYKFVVASIHATMVFFFLNGVLKPDMMGKGGIGWCWVRSGILGRTEEDNLQSQKEF